MPPGRASPQPPTPPTCRSPETYLGFARAENFLSPGSFARDSVKSYALPARLVAQSMGAGRSLESQRAKKSVLDAPPGRVVFRFRARDLHLVLGPGPQNKDNGKPVRFRVLLDGKPPGADHGMDIDAGRQWHGA